MTSGKKFFHPSWRSHYRALLSILLLSYMILRFTPLLETSFEISLTFMWFIPIVILGNVAIRVYDIRYYFEEDGVTSVKGILSLFKHKSTVRFEDIRSLEVTQSIMGRILGFGNLEIGTAASAGIEVSMVGVADPLKLLKRIESGRDVQEQQPSGRPLVANSRLENS